MNKQEMIELFGLQVRPEIAAVEAIAEVKNEAGEITTAAQPARAAIPAVDPSVGMSFYEVSMDDVDGSPIEFASHHVTADCFATVVGDVLCITTHGTCDVGTEVTE